MTLKSKKQKSSSKKLNLLLAGLLGTILFFSVTRYYVADYKDNDRCKGMLNHGKWMTDEYKEWQPSGCIAKTYHAKDIDKCLGDTRIIYIGDSIMREQYYSMTGFLGHPIPKVRAVHSDQTAYIKKQNITFEMWWDPFINQTRTIDLLQGNNKDQKPSLLIIGSGIWYIRRAGPNYLSLWKTAIDRVFDGVIHHDIADKVLLSPVEMVEYDMMNKNRKKILTKDKITIMNNYLHERERLLDQTIAPFGIPFVWNEIVTSSKNQTVDGVHFKPPVTIAEAQLALNYRCNDDISIKQTHYPYDSTCCYTYPTPAWYQTSILVFILLFIPACVIISYLPSSSIMDMIQNVIPTNIETLSGLFIFGLGLVYMFLGDRSQLLGKINKQYDIFTFMVLCLIMVFLGIVTLKRNTEKDGDAGFLNRDQTDEWKGWMQVIILIYHFTGATGISVIYNPIRVLVAAYLFQTGYGHFFFFYKKQDFGVYRFLNVMIRMNLLTCVLCYLMKTDYLFYYFSPLVTLWFCVIWITMRIKYTNKSSWFILTKVCVMSALTGLLIHYPGVLEAIFGALKFLFKVKWDAASWRFRLALDAWIVYVGMLCALLTIKLKEHQLIKNHTSIWNMSKWIALAMSILGLVGYGMFEMSQTKGSYTKYHPYISWIPILSFIVIRNFSRFGRNIHSRFFGFIGKISLETYIGQFHMWLAADTHGLLVVLPKGEWVVQTRVGWYMNLIVSSIIFMFVCYQINQATGVVTKWLCSGVIQRKEGDYVPLLPTSEPNDESLLATNNSHQMDNDDEIWDKPTAFEKVSWFKQIYSNRWIRAFVYVVILGFINRFCY